MLTVQEIGALTREEIKYLCNQCDELFLAKGMNPEPAVAAGAVATKLKTGSSVKEVKFTPNQIRLVSYLMAIYKGTDFNPEQQ